MASPSGTSSGSSMLLNSGSEEVLQAVDDKKHKRMISNRESARRSRMRKQKHLEDLVAQVSKLSKENSHAFSILSIIKQHCSAVEAENSVLRAQMMELSTRLQSLNEILNNLNGSRNSFLQYEDPQVTNSFIIPWKLSHMNQPVMASAEKCSTIESCDAIMPSQLLSHIYLGEGL